MTTACQFTVTAVKMYKRHPDTHIFFLLYGYIECKRCDFSRYHCDLIESIRVCVHMRVALFLFAQSRIWKSYSFLSYEENLTINVVCTLNKGQSRAHANYVTLTTKMKLVHFSPHEYKTELKYSITCLLRLSMLSHEG